MQHLLLILLYSAAQIALGLYIGRRVRGTSDFFVAGRRLGPGLLFATLLAANIGAGSTLNAAGLGYRYGVSVWWWVGSAGIGSLVLAFTVGPRIRRLAAQYDLRTVGDFLEWRYDARVRGAITALLWVGTLFLLAGQLKAIAFTLNAIIGIPTQVASVIGGLVITAYFAAGGLMASAAVNVVQLVVKMIGFAIALPLALATVGGLEGLRAALPDPAWWRFTQNGPAGWVYLAMLAPPFIVSPGLLQKLYAARDDRAVRLGVGLNAIGLLVFAIIPPLLGMVARIRHPGLVETDSALPLLFVHDLPPLVGSLALAALFSAEVSAADAVLFMLTTSLSQDLYRRFVDPSASDRRILTVTRWTAIVSGTLGVLLANMIPTLLTALSIFYTLMGVSLFVPVIAGLYNRNARTPEALAAILAGVASVVAVQLVMGDRGIGGLTPSMLGLASACLAWLIVTLLRPRDSRRAA
jgi:solute:Na+ symporter, SSS family